MSGYEARQPISWIVATVDQLTRGDRTGSHRRRRGPRDHRLPRTARQPRPERAQPGRLVSRCRSQLLTWAWEQGHYDEEIPSRGQTRLLESKGSLAAPCGALLTGSISP